jgi:hypothetical protein
MTAAPPLSIESSLTTTTLSIIRKFHFNDLENKIAESLLKQTQSLTYAKKMRLGKKF